MKKFTGKLTYVILFLQSLFNMENNDKPIIPLTPEMTIPAYRSEVLDNICTSLLNRNVAVEIPTAGHGPQAKASLLVLNDGQNMAAVKVKKTVERMVGREANPTIIVVGIVATDRLRNMEFAHRLCGRGKMARLMHSMYCRVVPAYIQYNIPSPLKRRAGYGRLLTRRLIGMDIAWNHPRYLEKRAVQRLILRRRRDAEYFLFRLSRSSDAPSGEARQV